MKCANFIRHCAIVIKRSLAFILMWDFCKSSIKLTNFSVFIITGFKKCFQGNVLAFKTSKLKTLHRSPLNAIACNLRSKDILHQRSGFSVSDSSIMDLIYCLRKIYNCLTIKPNYYQRPSTYTSYVYFISEICNEQVFITITIIIFQ